jgi:YhcG PDDEXK nuclease domain
MMPRSSANDATQYWVWVATPEHYLEEDGSDREDLDPSLQSDPGGWWTCHQNTKRGDLVLLYRTKPKMDFGYLIQAETDAYSIADDEYAYKQGWDYGCDYRVLYQFQHPLTLHDLRVEPYMDDWGAFRGNFQRRAYAVPPSVWQRLLSRMEQREPEFACFLRRGGVKRVSAKIMLEEELEQRLAENPAILRPFGYDLEVRERQLVCIGHGGRIDLLCYDRKRKRYVVVELKNVRAGQNTFGQIATYLRWVEQRLSNGRPAEGLVLARGFDNRFLSAVATTDRVRHIDLEQLGFK